MLGLKTEGGSDTCDTAGLKHISKNDKCSCLLKQNALVLSGRRRNRTEPSLSWRIMEFYYLFLLLGSQLVDCCVWAKPANRLAHKPVVLSETALWGGNLHNDHVSVWFISSNPNLLFLYRPPRGAVYCSAVPNRMSKAPTWPRWGYRSQRGPTHGKNLHRARPAKWNDDVGTV